MRFPRIHCGVTTSYETGWNTAASLRSRAISAMKPVQLEIVVPMLTTVGLNCPKCSPLFEQVGLNDKYRRLCSDEYSEDWKIDLEKITGWAKRASDLYKHRLHIRIIDAQSPLGMWKRIRHGFLKTPAFIVERKPAHIGWGFDRLELVIDEVITEAAIKVRKG